MKNRLSAQLAKNEQGAVLILVGLSIALLIGFVGIAIDSGRYFLVRNKMSSALDSAVLATANIATPSAVEDDPGILQRRAENIFTANFPDNFLNTTVNDIQINYDASTGSVDGTVTADIDFIFEGIYDLAARSDDSGNDSANIEVFSEVIRTLNDRTLEIAFVVDNSASMCNIIGTGARISDAEADPACIKFQQVKESLNNTIDQVEDAVAGVGNVASAYFSYIPYLHDVRINGSTSNFNLCDRSLLDDIPSATGLISNSAAIRQRINDTNIQGEGGTNSAVGLWWGWASLREDSVDLFRGSSAHENTAIAPGPIDTEGTLETIKTLLLLSDGSNAYVNKSCSGVVASGSEAGGGFHTDETVRVKQQELCESIKQEGVTLYTIGYDIDCDGTAASELRSCASEGNFICAETTGALGDALDAFVNSLIDLRITQ